MMLISTVWPNLSQKRIVLGVTGSIAAYKALELVRQLTQAGALVDVVLTPSAQRFITPLSFQALSGRPVYTDQWPQAQQDGAMPHIHLSRGCDLLVVAPCTAHSMAQFALGLGDGLLANLVLARQCPMAIAPAMNVEMWQNPATQRHMHTLKQDGVAIWGPAHGSQACGEVGDGRFLEPHELLAEIAREFTPKTLLGKHVLITSGPTFEPIDPVRGITNRSSGKMGYALAKAAFLLGAKVSLITGPTAMPAPYGAEVVHVETAQQMLEAVLHRISDVDVFVSAAAVADYGIANPTPEKIKKSKDGQQGYAIDWKLNPDILATVGQLAKQQNRTLLCIGFAAETQHLEQAAKSKLLQKQAHWIVANQANETFGSEMVALSVYSVKGEQFEIPKMQKLNAALDLFKLIVHS